MASVTITGTAEQIVSTITGDDAPTSPKPNRGASQRRQQAITAKRKIVRQAFDLIRHDREQIDAADHLAGALGGRYALNQDALDLADRIIKASQLPNGTRGGEA